MIPSLDTGCRVEGVTENMLNSRFNMKDLGLADVVLEIKILKKKHHMDSF